MAKFSKGILGGFSGKVGNVVGGTWKGIDYMRSKPNNVKDPKTDAQLAQRQKFAMVTSFLKKVKPIIQAGFKTNTKQMTPVNSAMSYNLKNAISGDYPNLQIDYASVVVARGDLMPGQDADAASNAENEITFSWSDNSGMGSANADDKALLLLYSPVKDRALYIAGEGPERQEESYSPTLPSSYGGVAVEAYLAFASADGTDASDSDYLGSVTITEPSP